MEEETQMRLVSYAFACICGFVSIAVGRFVLDKLVQLITFYTLPLLDFGLLIPAVIFLTWIVGMTRVFFLIAVYGNDVRNIA